MQRYVIINHRNGYIIATSEAETPILACQRLDEPTPRQYELVESLTPNDSGFRVYDADGGCAFIPTTSHSEHPHLIELVEQECPLVATVRIVT
jgi:hypothetical protein